MARSFFVFLARILYFTINQRHHTPSALLIATLSNGSTPSISVMLTKRLYPNGV